MSDWVGIHRALRLAVLSSVVTATQAACVFGADCWGVGIALVGMASLATAPLFGVAAARLRGSWVRRALVLEGLAVSLYLVGAIAYGQRMNYNLFAHNEESMSTTSFFLGHPGIFLLPTLVAVAVLDRWTQRLEARA